MGRDVRWVDTDFGRIAYEEQGSGPAALFVHGVFLNGYLWRNVAGLVADSRRCIAVDLLAHGLTETRSGQDLSFPAQAEMLAAVCDALGLAQIDLIGNDSGGAIAQIFAVRYPERLRTLTLTNCDVHDNWPPEAFAPTMQLAADGGLKALGESMMADMDLARAALGAGYEHPESLSDETISAYIGPLQSDDRFALLERWFAAMDHRQTVEIESQLRHLDVPTLIVWGTDDHFFDVKWAYWLAETIPGAGAVVELEGARLFFPEERPQDFAAALRDHWGLEVQASEPGRARERFDQ